MNAASESGLAAFAQVPRHGRWLRANETVADRVPSVRRHAAQTSRDGVSAAALEG